MVSGLLTPSTGAANDVRQRAQHAQGQRHPVSECFSHKKDGNAADHSHHSSGNRRTPLLEGKEHRHSIAFSASFAPVIPGGCTHRQREAAKYNEASESTSNSRQGHVGSTLRRRKPGTSSSHKPPSGRATPRGSRYSPSRSKLVIRPSPDEAGDAHENGLYRDELPPSDPYLVPARAP
jgi:hypothetical protein